MIVVVISSVDVSLDGADPEELIREDDAVIGEFSVVLSVGITLLELLKTEDVATLTVVLSITGLLDSGAEYVET